MDNQQDVDRYTASCDTPFWQQVFEHESNYLMQHISKNDHVLSVGCGPAVIERSLIANGYQIVGMDVSAEALHCAKDTFRVVTASAEDMPFPPQSFDVVLFIASLQFITDIHSALKKTALVLKPNGKMIALLLNPASDFFTHRSANPESYLRKMKHQSLNSIIAIAGQWFSTSGEYYLGVAGDDLFTSNDPATAALYILHATPYAQQPTV